MQEPLTTSGEDADFRKLLEDIKAGRQKKEVLLENSVFNRLTASMCRGLTYNAADADELTNLVRFKACDKFEQFEPEYDQTYGNFFAWVRRIARNLVISDHRRKSITYSDERPEEMHDVRDGKTSAASVVEVDEAVQRFLTLVAALSHRDRRIVEIWIEGNYLYETGYSSRQIKEKLREEGIPCSHVTVGKVVEDVTSEFMKREETHLTTVSRKGEQRAGRRGKGDPPTEGDISVRKTGS